MENLNHLIAQIKNCTICEPYLPLGVNPVSQLSDDAKILIAGQAPGIKVHKSGIPFDDASGNRLREWLGITKEQFYNPELISIIPMGFCYPGTGKSGDLPPRKECVQKWHDKLMNRFTQFELTIILGKYAIDYHIGKSKKTLTEHVKNWADYWPDKIVLPHPSPRNNIWLKKNPWFEIDVIPELQKRTLETLRTMR